MCFASLLLTSSVFCIGDAMCVHVRGLPCISKNQEAEAKVGAEGEVGAEGAMATLQLNQTCPLGHLATALSHQAPTLERDLLQQLEQCSSRRGPSLVKHLLVEAAMGSRLAVIATFAGRHRSCNIGAGGVHCTYGG